MAIAELSKIYPIESVDGGIIVLGVNDVTVVYKLSLPYVFTNNPERYNEINREMSNVFRALPKGACVQCLSFYWPSTYESDFSQAQGITQVKDLQHYHQKPVMNNETYLCVTLSDRKSVAGKEAISSKLWGEFEYVFNRKVKLSEDTLREYARVFDSFKNTMNYIPGVRIHALGEKEVKRLLYRFHTFDFDFKPKEGEDGKIVWPSIPPIDIKDDYFTVGGEYFKVFSLQKMGDEITTSLKNNAIKTSKQYGTSADVRLPVSYSYVLGLGLPIKHCLCVSLEILDNELVVSTLKNQNTWLKILAGLNVSFAKMRMDYNDSFTDVLLKRDGQAVNQGLNVIISDKDLDSLREKADLVKVAFSRMNSSTCYEETRLAFDAYMFTLPGVRKNWSRNKITFLEAAVAYFPKEQHYEQDPEGFYFLDRFGKPVMVDFWHTHHVTNVNEVIIGPSGSGKSFFALKKVSDMLAKNYSIVILDVGHSYRDICHIAGGKYFDSENKETLGVNIFKIEAVLNEKGAYEEKMNLIFNILSIIWKGEEKLNQAEKTILRELITNFYAKENLGYARDAEGFYKYVEAYFKKIEKDHPHGKFFDVVSFLLIYKTYVYGEYAWVFKDSGNKDLDDYNFLVFSLKSIEENKTLYPIYTLIVIEQILGKIRRLPLSVRKAFYIDEAWAIFKGEMGGFVEYLFRTVRKEGGKVGVITQNAADILSSGIADAIKINTDIKILLEHKSLDESTQRTLRSALGLDTRDLELLASLKYSEKGREFFVKFGTQPMVYINEVSSYSSLVYSTTAEQVGVMRDLEKKYGGFHAAVSEYLYQLNEQ